jgi:hypothetical protein
MLTTALLALHVATHVTAQFGCDALAEAALEVPFFNADAPLSIDELAGPAPRNLVVFRAPDGGFGTGMIEHDDTIIDVPQSSGTSFLQRFEPGPLMEARPYRFTIMDAFMDPTDPNIPSRMVTFESGDFLDVEPPTIDDDFDVQIDFQRGGPSLVCGPSWQPDLYTITADVPAASDDHGVAGFELWLTVDGVESAYAAVVVGGKQLVAMTTGSEPERVRIVALDHAGNQSKPREASDGDGAGCASTRSSLATLGALASLLRRRRRAGARVSGPSAG